jgi:hypothetical protein
MFLHNPRYLIFVLLSTFDFFFVIWIWESSWSLVVLVVVYCQVKCKRVNLFVNYLTRFTSAAAVVVAVDKLDSKTPIPTALYQAESAPYLFTVQRTRK